MNNQFFVKELFYKYLQERRVIEQMWCSYFITDSFSIMHVKRSLNQKY